MILIPIGVVFLASLIPANYWPAALQVYAGPLKLICQLLAGATLGVVALTFGLVILLDFADLRRTLQSNLSKDILRNLTHMVYGIICFATLFSFVGTVLGGIWADQSWGRFWGWDPKENGALLIVLWCALILHARWGGFIRQRGLMAMTLGGNAITAFSWFGVNMLGVGLHSYGFMDKAFPWLVSFVIAQGVLMIIGLQPQSKPVKLPALAALPPALPPALP